MKVSLKWLKDYIDVDLAPKELAHKLTMAGTEVGEITTTGGNWDKVFVGSVKTVKKHPNADRLTICTVELPDETYEVICGAPNVAAGQRVGFAKAGAQLIDAHTGELSTLKAAKIRGVVSNGMICSERELGISEEHEGILVLPKTAPIGSSLQDYMGDSILELELTPNRPDCLSMLGVAWEVAALTDRTVKEPQISYKEQRLSTDSMISVEIVDPELCSRYSAAILTDIKLAPSPEWMQNHLIAAGMRPINNIVDVTNYVMAEYGQPLHAFDYTTLQDRKIIVRKAKPGEKLVTLDGETRPLDPGMLTISDTTKPVGLAGIMGGINSEVSESTTTILLESANFNNVNIRQTSSKLKLRSEASIRFDKGISPELTRIALCRAIQLIAELSGGRATSGIIDLYPGEETKRPIQLTQQRVIQVLGIPITPATSHRVLTSLGFHCKSLGKDAFEVTPPFWRTDISIEDDLVEEVIRVIGYDEVPAASIRGQIPLSTPDPARNLRETLRDLSVAVGLQEVINYSLSDLESLGKAGLSNLETQNSLRITNPLRLEQEYLRLSLRPGLLANIAHNQKHQENPLGLFEIGKVYFARDADLPKELEILAGVVTCISEKPEDGFILIKGIIETILDRLGAKVQFERGDEPGFHPGRVVKIIARGDEIGMLGEIHPKVIEAFGIIEASVHCFEIHLDVFQKHIPVTKKYHPISKYPAVSRDFALIVDAQTLASNAEEIIKSFPLVTKVSLFDVYSGDQLVEGKKSLAYRVQFQSPSRTLNEEEVSIVEAQLLKKLNQSIGAVLRGTQQKYPKV